MSPEKKYLARTFFRLKIHESNGAAFERLFAQIMQYSRSAFVKIKPYGDQGDRGNDGYEKTEGRYFQMFAPEDPTTSKQKAIEKAEGDFEDKLLPYWGSFCEIKEYYFVFNDKYLGTNFPIEQTLAALKLKHKLTVADTYLAKHLEQEFIELQEDQILTVIGGLPDPDSLEGLDYSVLSEVIKYIQDTPPDVVKEGTLVVPDIDDKIQFNGLKQSGYWLKAKQQETWQIDEYFARNSEFAKDTLRNYLAGYYADSLKKFPENKNQINDDLGDLRFAAIVKKIAPDCGIPKNDRLRRDIAFIIMAKYFETCDIFKEPKNVIA